MSTGDSAYIKKINRSLIIQKIVEHGKISRADLSKQTNLTRATISAQVADLLEDELIIETQEEHHGVGRKPISLSLNSKAGYALGIDLDFGSITFTLSNLIGCPITNNIITADTSSYEGVLKILIQQINQIKAACSNSRYGVVGIVVGIHGLVTNEEIIHFIPSVHWHDKNLKDDLIKEFGNIVHIENNTNLCSFAERVFHYHHAKNVLCASLSSGIGLGIMMDTELFKGYDGYAGEAGHMIVVPGGKPCTCGNRGCWEQYASESTFFKELAQKKHNVDLSYEDVQKLLLNKDEDTCQMMEQFIYYLTIGLNNMINLYNPEVVVLNSELLRMNPPFFEQVRSNLSTAISHYRKLAVSKLGEKACVMGAYALAIKTFLGVPMLSLHFEEVKAKFLEGETSN